MSLPSDEEFLRSALRRRRAFWVCMAIFGGIPLFILGCFLGGGDRVNTVGWGVIFAPLLLWTGFCASRLLGIVEKGPVGPQPFAFLFLTILFAVLSSAIGAGVFITVCSAILK